MQKARQNKLLQVTSYSVTDYIVFLIFLTYQKNGFSLGRGEVSYTVEFIEVIEGYNSGWQHHYILLR